jgi:predicted MFS family arabinose efflux permease
MFLGALIGALAVLHGHQAMPLLLAALLLIAATVAASTLTRSDRSWAHP